MWWCTRTGGGQRLMIMIRKVVNKLMCCQYAKVVVVPSITLRPMSVVPFFKNAPLSRQFLHNLEVFSWKIIVKAN